MKINFEKYPDRLAPAIVQDAATGKVLMLGYMNEEAFEKTRSENRVTFFSRSKQRLWTKGETSGNFLDVADILADCDSDAILIKARPHGAVCHMGSDTCFGETNRLGISILEKLESTIADRFEHPQVQSYVSGLAAKGINKIAQKVGEEAVELVIEAKDANPDLFLGEAADLLFHFLILLKAKGFLLADVEKVLAGRMK